MRALDIVLFSTYALASSAAIMMIKQFSNPAIQSWKLSPGPSFPVIMLFLGAALYGLSFLNWIFILSRIQLSVAYPVAIGATLIVTTFGSWFLFKDSVGGMRLVGIAMIFGGALIVTRS